METKHVTNKNTLSQITLDKNKHQHKTYKTYKGPGKILENYMLTTQNKQILKKIRNNTTKTK